MKKIILSVAALALLSMSAHAANMKYAEEESGMESDYVEESAPVTASTKYYAGAGLAYETWPDYSSELGNGIALVLNGGMPLPQVVANFGVEVEMSFDLSGPSYETTYPSWNGTSFVNQTYSIDYSLFTLAGYATYSYEINSDIFLRGRAGLIYKSMSVDSSYTYSTAVSSSEIGVAFGGGAYYGVTPEIDAYVDMTLVDFTDFMHFTVGAQYKF